MKSRLRNVRALIVEGEPFFRDGIRRCMEGFPGYHVCGTAADAREARELCGEKKPDLIVLGLPVAGSPDFALVKELRKRHPKMQALVYCARTDGDTVVRALRAGAGGFMRRADGGPVLRKACTMVLEGRRYVSEEVEQSLLAGLAHGPHGGSAEAEVAELSERELEVFALMGEGHGPKAIAQELGISVKTEESHQKRIREKLHVPTMCDVRRRAEQWAGLGGAPAEPALAG